MTKGITLLRFPWNLFLLLVITLPCIAGCRSTRQGSTTPTAIIEPLVQALATSTPEPTIPPIATAVSLEEPLFSYIPIRWADIHMPYVYHGPWIYYIDYQQIRNDLHLDAIKGSDDRKTKLPLIIALGKSTQGLSVFDPITSSKLGSLPSVSGFYNDWGWDLADVNQALFFKDLNIVFLRGSFDAPLIQEKLTAKGFQKTDVTQGTFYQKENLIYTSTPDVLLIANTAVLIESNIVPIPYILSLLQFHARSGPSLQDHPIVKKIFADSERAWGFILTPCSDPGTTNPEEWKTGLPSEVIKLLEPHIQTSVPGTNWEILAASFRGKDEFMRIKFIYQYPDQESANDDLEMVRGELTNTPYSQSARLSDVLILERVEVDGNTVQAVGKTKANGLLRQLVDTRMYFHPFH